jgi:folate-binding protein YgfZ
MSTLPHGSCRLDDWGLIRAEGPDAASFLQGQLTQSVTDLATEQARLGGYCSAKGRLMANFILLREGPEAFCLLLPRELAPGLAKRLSMFVLRAKAKLRDASEETPLLALIGSGVPADLPVWGRRDGFIRLPDALGERRALHLGEVDGAALPRAAWDWAELHAGLAWVRQATAEHFVPQMLNWELVGGVNFQKGCYPGQEVVARSQYRGTVKRRTQLLLGGAAAPATELFAGPEREQAVGEVVAAASWNGQSALLAEVQLAAWAGDAVLQLPDGTPLRRAALPYAVVAPE